MKTIRCGVRTLRSTYQHPPCWCLNQAASVHQQPGKALPQAAHDMPRPQPPTQAWTRTPRGPARLPQNALACTQQKRCGPHERRLCVCIDALTQMAMLLPSTAIDPACPYIPHPGLPIHDAQEARDAHALVVNAAGQANTVVYLVMLESSIRQALGRYAAANRLSACSPVTLVVALPSHHVWLRRL